MDILLLHIGTPVEAPTGTTRRDALGYRAPSPSTAANLATAFFNIARARAGHPAVATNQGIFSYGWLLSAANCVRRYLCARPGHVAGARVALHLSNSPEYLAAFYGTLLADCVVVPLPVSLEAQRRRKVLELCQPDVLISRPEDFSSQESHSPIATLRLSESTSEKISFPRQQDRDLAMLLFTSGSMGMPKGVMLSHRNLLANADSILHELPICAGDRTLVVLPFCHAFGNSILQTHILSGATLLLDRTLTFPSSIVEALHKLEATSFSAVPEVYGMLLKYGRLGERPFPALRYMTVAGGELRHDLAVEIADRIAPASFHVMYGQSEAAARLTSLLPQQLPIRRGSIGKPIWGVELAVMDEANRELPPGAVGMLCARGKNVMLGYWQDPAATADVLAGDGWLRTGDLAHRDEEGYFYLHGRANLLVKVQGHRVHPAEIEGVVEAGFPQTCAVAIPIPRGDDMRFVLFLAPRDDRPIDVAKIRETCQRELPPYKLPLHYEVVDRFPLTSGHKIDRAALALLMTPRPAALTAHADDSLAQSR
ncbi:MAG TPA: class I adenylate-forming enzyme family protein [Pseudolabrys sp.]